MMNRIVRTAIVAALVGAAPAWAADGPSKLSLLGRPVPQVGELPDDAYGRLVRYGQALATQTFAHIGPEVRDRGMRYAGNNLACTSCHQDGATKPYAMPWIGVSASFPQYRGREDEVSTVEDRVNGCMERSMNGRPLPYDSREMKALVTYIGFLSQGVPVGAPIEGAAMRLSKMPNRRASPEAGRLVYAEQCAACHGPDGRGVRTGKPGDALGYAFPPLWGPDSFNDGAGMNRLTMATRFVKHNMPQGANHAAPQLSDDQAYDVAAWMVSQPRPRKARLEKDFPARWNKPVDSAFPPYPDDASADQHKYGPFPPLAEQARIRAEAQKALQAMRAAKAKEAAR